MSSSWDWRAWRVFKTGLAREEEQSLQLNRVIKLKELRVKALMSKKTPLVPRRDAASDLRIFQTVQGALASGIPVRFANRRAPAVISKGTYPEKDIIPGIEDQEEDLIIQVPLWEHTTERLKALAWVMVIGRARANARAFSLNLGPAVLAAAGRAQHDRSIGHARYLRDRLQKQLSNKLKPHGIPCPEFFFWMEADSLTGAHLHGAILLPDHPHPTKVLRLVHEALKQAGGPDWKPHAPQRQLALRRLWGPTGWVGYISKFELISKLRISDPNTVAATSGLRRMGADWYRAARASGDRIG